MGNLALRVQYSSSISSGTTTTWNTVASFPVDIQAASSTGDVYDSLTIGGNIHPDSSSMYNTSYRFDGNNWTLDSNIPVGSVYGGTAGTPDATLYWGGNNGTIAVDTTYEYNGVSWSSGGTLPTASLQMGSGGTQIAAWSIGGGTAIGVSRSTKNYRYNGTTWSHETDLTVATNLMQSAGTVDAIIMNGGITAGGRVSNTYLYDGVTWSSTTSSPVAISNGGGSGTQTDFLIYGGAITGTDASAATYHFDGVSWSTKDSLNQFREAFGNTGTGTAALAAGGNPDISGIGPTLSSAEVYGLTTPTTTNFYEYLDIDSSIPLRLDISKVESQDIGKLFGVGSQTFDLPGTKINNNFFNQGYDIGAEDIPGFYEPIDANVLLDGETILSSELRLNEIITSEDGYVTYKVTLTDKSVQFADALKGKFMADADWSAYNHTLTSGSIIDSWSDNLLSGSVFYPLADYGRNDNIPFPTFPRLALTASAGGISNTLTPLASRQLLPAIKLKDVVDVIFDQVGFGYTSSFIESADFQNLYLLTKANDNFGVIVDPSSSATFSAIELSSQSVPLAATRYVTASIESSDPQNAYNPTTSQYLSQQTGDHTFGGSITLLNPTFNDPGYNWAVRVDLELRTGDVGSYTVVDSQFDTFVQSDGIGPYTISVGGTKALTGGVDKAFLAVTYTQVAGVTSPAPGTLTITSATFNCTDAPTTYEGATVDMGLQFNSQLKSEDVIKGILSHFNLIVAPYPENQNIMQIEQFDTWIRQGEIKDWTDKYDTSQRISIKNTISGLPKNVYFKNTNDTDRFSKISIEQEPYRQYGTLEAIAASTNAQGDATIGDFFGPVILSSPITLEEGFPIDADNRMVIPHLYKFDNAKQVTYAFKPRIGYKVTNNLPSGSVFYLGNSANYLSVSGSYTTLSNTNALPVNSGSSFDLHFNTDYADYGPSSLGLSDAISNFDLYWKTYYDSLYWDEAKKITLNLYFTPEDFRDINLNDRIRIKNQFYRIDKISGLNLQQPDVVTVDLIRLYPAYFDL